MRAIDHRIVFMDGGVRFFATEYETWNFCGSTDRLRQELIDARTGSDFATCGKWCTGEQVSGLGAMNVSFEGFCVVESFDEEDGVANIIEWSENTSEF